MHRAWTQQDFGGRLPSEVFREHFLTCFISDPIGVEMRHHIGVDNMCWEADYPHSDSMWPTAPEELGAVFDANDVPDDEVRKMTHENAMRWYSFDPFTHIAREDATVGALRRQRRRPRRGDHLAQHPRPHARREARGLPGPGQARRRRRGADPDDRRR